MNTYEIIASSLKTVLDVSNESMLSTVSFDKTITAIITKVHDDGTYLVSNGTTKFKVSNSTDREYTRGASVKVLIPNGDYTKEKVIIGSVATAEELKLSSYVAPESKFVAGEAYKNMSLDLLLKLASENSASMDLSESLPIDYNNILNYNAIMVKLGLDTLTLKNLATKGTYTILIKITNVPTIEISSSELFGNVYYLAPEIIQTKMYSLDSKNRTTYLLESITLLLEGFEGVTEETKIELKSLEIIFGWNKEVKYPIGDQIAIVEESKDMMFGISEKNTQITADYWINNELNPEGYNIDYYIYQVGYLGDDEEIAAAGTYWKRLDSSQINLAEYAKTWQEVLIKAVLVDKDKNPLATSNILTYQNKNKIEVEFTETRDLLVFTVPQTIYNIYGNDGKLISNLQDLTLTVRLASNLPIPTGSTVTWSFPDTATQLEHKGETEVSITEKSETISTTFNFKRQYQPNWLNNTITCTIESDGISHTGSIGINIGSANTNGTPFSLNIVPENGTIFYGDPLTFIYSFLDAAGNHIPIEDIGALEWNWPGAKDDENSDNSKIIITGYPEDKSTGILKLTYKGFLLEPEQEDGTSRTVDLEAYYPIPWANGDNYTYMIGATSVIYDWLNLNPSYSRDAYKLYDKDGAEVTDLAWGLSNSSDLSLITINEDSYLRPQAIKPTTLNVSCIYARQNGEELWSYPILITNNAYAFEVLNNWSGTGVSWDEKNGTILSNLLGAGIKSNNKFTGILIGAVNNFSDNIIGAATGLYGFQDSNLRFKFDENGEAWIGTDDNYISLSQSEGFKINTNNFTLTVNGESEKIPALYISNTAKLLPFGENQNEYNFNIYSNGNFGVTSTGLLYATGATITGDITATNLTLTGTATIDAAKIKGTLSAAKISAGSITAGNLGAGGAVKIGTETPWSIDNNSIYNGFWGNKDKGLTFVSTGTTGNAFSLGGSPNLNGWVFGCYPNFGVTKSGALYALNANISGTITASLITNGTSFSVTSTGYLTASSGRIGPWSLNDKGFYKDDNNITTVYLSDGSGNGRDITHVGTIEYSDFKLNQEGVKGICTVSFRSKLDSEIVPTLADGNPLLSDFKELYGIIGTNDRNTITFQMYWVDLAKLTISLNK